MTRKEAIKRLQDAKDGYKQYLTDEALDIAIKALEQEDWHDSEEPPTEGEYILLSFSNFSIPLVGRYEGGAYYIGDDLTTALSQDIYVNGWMELPKCKEDK